MMSFEVDMCQFEENWVWDMDTVQLGDLIAKTKGKFVAFNGNVYLRLLHEFNITFKAE